MSLESNHGSASNHIQSSNKESLQLLNTAIIKHKEKSLDGNYEHKLNKVCQSPAIKSIDVAISHLAETQKISRDQAAFQIIEAIKELESVWSSYVLMEGISNLKGILREKNKH